MSRRTARILAGVLGLLVVLPAVLVGNIAATAAADGGKGGKDNGASGSAGKVPFSLTKVLTRNFKNADGSTYDFPSNTVTVNVDQTNQLRGRQRVNVSWSGAQPSGGRASNPYGINGLQQEYPVMILQCRGIDDPSLPVAQQVSPETCFTSSVAERSQVTRSENEQSYRHDVNATDIDKARLSGIDPFPGADVCKGADTESYSTHLTPFVAANGTVYPACDSAHMPPEASVDAAFPPNEIAAFTDQDGNGSTRFEVRSNVENESLGCSEKVACSIVVIPINGLSCETPAPRTESTSATPTVTASPSSPESPSESPTASTTLTASATASDSATASTTPTASPTADGEDNGAAEFTVSEAACRKGGRFLPGSSNFVNDGADQSVSPALWWSASNWDNRFSVPVTFGLPPDTCDVLDPRPPTGFYGSELLAQAALQWSPAYCLNKKRFKFQLNQMSDEAGFKLMDGGQGAAAEVSSKYKSTSHDPVGYAPTAVTGFGIGYNIDLPDNQGDFTNLKMNARLIAKLMTESYLGSDLGRGHPGMSANPLSIMSDPEFTELNPGLSANDQEAAASLLSLSNASDLIEQLTEYLADDKDAMNFINGKPDPWGMVVNPSYKKLTLPRAEWPLLDSYIPVTQNQCRQANPSVYFTQLAAPVTTLRKIADALLDGWPNTQTRCDYDVANKTYKLGRIDRQAYGSRFMLGLVSLPDAKRYGLRTAALETKPDTYVGPNDASVAAALTLTEQSGKREPFVLDLAKVRRSGSAYPGTMTVYTAAKLGNLDEETAGKVAQFIRVSTTEGQQTGPGNGELPEGYLPITKSGATAKLWAAAQDVADAVEKQPFTKRGDGGGGDTPSTATTNSSSSGNALPAPAPVGAPDPARDVPTDTVVAGDLPSSQPVAMPRTTALSSGLAARLLPLLMIVGLLGLGAATGARFFVRPPRGRS